MLWHPLPRTSSTRSATGSSRPYGVGRVKRLVIDGLLGFQEIAADRPHRIGRFLTALANEFRGLSVTTVYTAETRNLIGGVIEGPTIAYLQLPKTDPAPLRRDKVATASLISVVKMRTATSTPRCGSSASCSTASNSPVRSTAPRRS